MKIQRLTQRSGLRVQTHLKSGAQGCEQILNQMDKLIKDFQDLRGEMDKMAKQMEQGPKKRLF